MYYTYSTYVVYKKKCIYHYITNYTYKCTIQLADRIHSELFFVFKFSMSTSVTYTVTRYTRLPRHLLGGYGKVIFLKDIVIKGSLFLRF